MSARSGSPRHRSIPAADRVGDITHADPLATIVDRISFASRSQPARHALGQPFDAPAPPPADMAWPSDDQLRDPAATDIPDNDPEEPPSTSIRPYAWTGGRTRSNHQLELETLVSSSEKCQLITMERLEHHSIAGLCSQPRSVAEVGALLEVPVGVARVLIGDMADLGLITVHRTFSDTTSPSHLMLMERVLSGLRRL